MRSILSVLIGSAGSLTAMEMQIIAPPADTSAFGRIHAVSSDGGHMAGEAIALVGLEREAVTWNVTGGMTLAAISAADPSIELATGISDDGTVVAGWSLLTRSTSFVLVEGETSPALTNNGDYRIHAMSPDGGTAVGRDAISNNSYNFNAAIWNLGSGARTAVADLAGGAANAAFLAISTDGQTCVGYGEDGSGRLAVRSVSGGALASIGDLAGGQVFAEARGASADGSVIVGRSRSTSGMEAFRWTTAGITGLGDLPGGAFVSEACSVSDDGTIVVGTAESELGAEVFVWMPAGGMRSLRTVALAGGVDLSDWHFTGAWPVLSGDGDVLALNAIDPWQAPRFLRIAGLQDALAAGDPAPALGCAREDGGFCVRFIAQPGLRYQLQSSQSLAGQADWQDEGTPLTGDGTEVELTLPIYSGNCFYRLMLVP